MRTKDEIVGGMQVYIVKHPSNLTDCIPVFAEIFCDIRDQLVRIADKLCEDPEVEKQRKATGVREITHPDTIDKDFIKLYPKEPDNK